MTETEESELLVVAERHRLEKAARTHIDIAPRVGDTLEASLSRLKTLTLKPIATPVEIAHEREEKLRKDAGIPKRHDKLIPPSDSLWEVKRRRLVDKLGSGFLYALTGTQGTGKTQMGAALVYAAAYKLRSAKYACAMDFFIDLKSTFQEDAESREGAVIARYVKPKLLVLDEMDERSESAWENRLLFHMLNQRYNLCVDTLLITRRSADEFLASVGLSIQSRLQETGSLMVCDWPSWRDK